MVMSMLLMLKHHLDMTAHRDPGHHWQSISPLPGTSRTLAQSYQT